MKYKKLRIALIAILTLIFAISAFHVIKIIHDYKTADKANMALQERFAQKVQQSDEEKETPPIRIDFDALMQENSDIIGWIYCPDTPINYPVVKGKDNRQYLRSDLKGKYLAGGTIFADYRNGDVGEDPNFIIYGHNMLNDTMFGTLVKYKEQSYYDAHPLLYFLTPENSYTIELCAGGVVKPDSDIYKMVPQENTVTDFIAKSTFQSTAAIDNGESIITLSTCSYEFNSARYVLIGKLK